MLHELSHNVHGPHDAKFHALWDQLRKEYEGLLAKGYTGEGFLSEGRQLGGRRVPIDEARRIARIAAEKRRTLTAGSGQKLGGRPVPLGTDIRRVIADATERRSTVLKGCGSDRISETRIQELGNQAISSGFKTKAAEDEANDRAIAQALWELVQEDEMKEYGSDYISPTPANPTGNGGGKVSSKKPLRTEAPPIPTQSKPPPIRKPSDRPVSRLVAEQPAKKPKTLPPRGSSSSSSASAITTPTPAPAVAPAPVISGWTCEVCTLHNPINFLMCDACTTERPGEVTKRILESQRRASSTPQAPSSGPRVKTWTCRCSTVMEEKWWSCSSCGKCSVAIFLKTFRR